MWQEKKGELYRNFVFKDFKQAFSFIQSVANEAERLNHHPRWENDYNRVQIWLSTHEAEYTITDRDRQLAEAIDGIYDENEKKDLTKNEVISKSALKLYTDGGSRGNPGPSASGYVILDMNDTVLLERGVYLGITTNNQAEYQALKLGLEEVQKMHAKSIEVYMDSLLVVNQMIGKFKVKNPEFIPIHNAIKQLVATFQHVSFTHVPRALNKRADAMVNKALDESI